MPLIHRMEDQRSEQEFDEFEKLLGEIPGATSGNPHFEDGGLKSVFPNGSLAPICVDSCVGPLTEKFQHNGRFDERKLLLNNTKESPIQNAHLEEANLPDDQSLTSAFAEMSFKGGSLSENCKTSPHYTVPLDCEYINSMKTSYPCRDPPVMVVPAFHSPSTLPHCFDAYNMAKAVQENTNMLKFDAQEQRKMPIGHCQTRMVENYSTALPLAHGVQGFQFLSNVAVPDVEFQLMSNQQQCFPDVQSHLPYLHSQQINQPRINWRNIEEEPHYRMHQQYVYLQQLRNQRLEVQHPIQVNGDVATKMMNPNMRQPYFEMPIAHQLRQSNQESFCNKYAAARDLNQSQSALQILDIASKQGLPEKMMARSQGLNPLNDVKFGSVGANETLPHHQNVKILPNGHFRQSLSNPTAGCFQLDPLCAWNVHTNIPDAKCTDLRSQPQKYDSVDDYTGRIYIMAKDQHGCRFLQRKFSEGSPQDVKKIFLEIIDHIVELMTDPFGNYLVQKLLEVCDEDQKMQILRSITGKRGELVRISCDMHGTRAVQKVIEKLKTPEQFSMIVNSLKPGIVTLIKNMNGNHVAQRCLQYLLPEYREFLFEATTDNCVELATDRHGCCVLQKCLGHSEGEQRCHLVREITLNALILCQDPFGNYVVQFVFELRLPWATVNILDQLEGNYGDLSMQKYSSNVVEKCLKYAGDERRTRIIQELMNSAHLDQIMQDPYGNYVIQAALHQSKGAVHCALVEAIKPHVPLLRTSPYGKKVLSSNSLKK